MDKIRYKIAIDELAELLGLLEGSSCNHDDINFAIDTLANVTSNQFGVSVEKVIIDAHYADKDKNPDAYNTALDEINRLVESGEQSIKMSDEMENDFIVRYRDLFAEQRNCNASQLIGACSALRDACQKFYAANRLIELTAVQNKKTFIEVRKDAAERRSSKNAEQN